MKLGYVGLPCQLQALRKVDYFSEELEQDWTENVAITIGLFCRENWAYSCFRAMVEDDYGISLDGVEKFDIKRNKIIAKSNEKTVLKIPLSESKPFVRVGCQVCLDFSGELCDLSIGAVGTPPSTSTVMVRTGRGERLLKEAERNGYIEVKLIEEVKPGMKLVKRLTDQKREESLEEAGKRQSEGFPVNHIATMGSSDVKSMVEQARGKSFADLEREVIDAGNCTACGTCVAVSRGRLVMREERPQLKGEDSPELWRSYSACPRAFLPLIPISEDYFKSEENLSRDSLGYYGQVFSVKATEKAGLKKWQDGGAVTAILAYAMKAGHIQAVVSASHNQWEPKPAVSKSLEELYECAGTIYSYVTNMPELKREAER